MEPLEPVQHQLPAEDHGDDGRTQQVAVAALQDNAGQLLATTISTMVREYHDIKSIMAPEYHDIIVP